ncbi:hypothetical protein OCK74_21390 [Chitinophagaceae bacterium LB-8]|uniref:Outer membrane lipoprotein-sorting protein n=1 Tax=Paraflavisolibacter caeni TaxID=2982496 RepID=A0A9X2XY25_9BACT|nr:hypothetical protein [Paraflavisolibacter caeni]MCU7551689.1 hypothetical protein [Paraflavisolibacter caeni]
MQIFRIFCFVLLQMTSFHFADSQSNTSIKDAYNVISNSIEAMGGKEYLESIHTLYSDVKTEMGERQVHWIVKEMKPNKGSFQITYNKKIVYQNWFDGQNGYEIVGGQKREANAEEFKDKLYKRNIFNELDYIDSSLWTLELMGAASVNGEQCYKIRATSVDGSVRTLYYSKATFWLLKEEKVVNSEKDTFSTVLFSGYKKFGKLTYYTEMKLGSNGEYQTATIEKLLVNAGVSVNDFK